MLDKLYYIFHCSVKGGLAHAERASFLLSSALTFYGYSLYFLLVVFTKSKVYNTPLFYIVFAAFGLATIFGTSRYFVKAGRYRRIIDKYGSPRSISKRKRFLYRCISFGLFLGAFAAFTVTGIALGKYLDLIRL